MKFALKIALQLLAASSLASSLAAAEPMPDRRITYKKVGDGELKLHLFNPPGHKISDKTPAIVFFFGGGWNGGAPKQFYPQCAYFASRGLVAVSAEYRTYKSHKTSPRECVMDGKSAVRWLRSHAVELGIDPDKIAAGGGSAGGHVAATTGTVTGFNEKGEDTTVSCIPNALVLFNPVYDNGPKGYGYSRVKDYWKEFSPMHNLSKATPPTIVFLGTKDELIPVATAKEYQKRMKALGIRSDLHLYEGQPHGFFNKQKYQETVIETDKFLKELGFLKGEPTLK
ncbi:MAG: alpha/beta hydrolase fold domain-containing protein [Akkermansiaceae bacterium]|nr:alpha/beta hydrolase fold domain-containing protein [Akkermansiaceae bacterium]